jgi:hypothetical protein
VDVAWQASERRVDTITPRARDQTVGETPPERQTPGAAPSGGDSFVTFQRDLRIVTGWVSTLEP